MKILKNLLTKNLIFYNKSFFAFIILILVVLKINAFSTKFLSLKGKSLKIGNFNINKSIPNLSFIAGRFSYFNEQITEINDKIESNILIESKDKAFRSNVLIVENLSNSNSTKKVLDIIISYRGTEAFRIQNLMADVNLKFTELSKSCPGCLVHEGFFTAMKTIEDRVFEVLLEELKKIELQDKQIGHIYFTGHSLGGAMASLSVFELLTRKRVNEIDKNNFSHYLKKFDPKISLITFGSPKVGNKNFVDFFEKSTDLYENIRVVYGLDVVAELPPENGMLKYEHSGSLIYFRQNEFNKYEIVVDARNNNLLSELQKGKSNENEPENFLNKIFSGIKDFAQTHNKVLDHLKYYIINREAFEEAVNKIRKMIKSNE